MRIVMPNVSGCGVPVTVAAGAVASDRVTAAIAVNGGFCSSPSEISQEDLVAVQVSGKVSIGTTDIGRAVIKSGSGTSLAHSE